MKPARSRSRRPVVGVVAAVFLVAATIALIATRDDNSNGGSDAAGSATGVEQTRPVRVTGDAPAVFQDGPDTAVGVVAPALIGAGFDGTPVEIRADGQPKVVVFLAHWCPHCRREVPVLVDWLAENGNPEGVVLHAVATGTSADRPNYPPSEWLEREGFPVPVLADTADGSAATAFGLSSFPYFVALDGAHRVVARTAGELTGPQWEALLDAARSSANPPVS